VVVSAAEYERLVAARPDFKEYLLSMPDLDELEIPARGPAREVEL